MANGCGPGPFGPSITFSLVALFVSCDDGVGDEVEHEPVFLLLVGGGAGWDRQTARYEMLPMMYDSTLGDEAGVLDASFSIILISILISVSAANLGQCFEACVCASAWDASQIGQGL